MRKLCKIEEIRLQIWKGPLYNLSKYAVGFGLRPQIRVHRPLHFPWWPPVFANGHLFLSIFLYIFLREGPLAHFDGPSLHKSRVFPENMLPAKMGERRKLVTLRYSHLPSLGFGPVPDYFACFTDTFLQKRDKWNETYMLWKSNHWGIKTCKNYRSWCRIVQIDNNFRRPVSFTLLVPPCFGLERKRYFNVLH